MLTKSTGIAAQNPALFDGGTVCEYKGRSCGQCWKLDGPAGSRLIGVTDCCAGYVTSFEEKGREERSGEKKETDI